MLEALVIAQLAGAPAVDAAALERLVRHDCGACHGLTLKGGLGPPLTAEALDGLSAEEIAGTVLEGRAGTAMPPWRGLLSEEEARWIAGYLLEGAE